jgi:EpsI family protein
MLFRISVLTACFLIASAMLAKVSETEPILVRESLTGLPRHIGPWQQSRDFPFDSRTEGILGADDYLNRVYVTNDSWISLYIGYYLTQRQGSTIHSPLNCLPGAGWNPVSKRNLAISIQTHSGATDTIQVNRLIIEKGLERQLVLYWYQAHGRVVASEYWGKIYTVADAIRMNRTDAALVRVIRPITAMDSETEMAAERSAVQFVQSIFPNLYRHIPH